MQTKLLSAAPVTMKLTTSTLAASTLVAALLCMPAHATTIDAVTDGRWYQFDVDDLYAADGGLQWIDGIFDDEGLYTGDGSALSFSFTSTRAATLTVVDAAIAGDEFKVTINGQDYFTSASLDPDSTSVGTLFDAALSDGHRYSFLNILLNPGTYTVTGALTASALDNTGAPYNATVGGFKVEEVPVPAAAWLFGSALAAGMGIARRRN